MHKLDDVFPSREAAEAYEKALNTLWTHSVVEANEAIKAAKAVLETPVAFLLDPGPGPTFLWLANILLERAALRTINALTDDTGGALTFESLREQLLSTCRPEIRAEVEAEVSPSFKSTALNVLRSRAIRHRHTVLAHLSRGRFETPGSSARVRITLMELEALLEAAMTMLDALSIDAGRGCDLIRPSGDDSLEFILEATMKTSTLLNMPEEQGMPVFQALAERFTPTEREVFVEWRQRLGLRAIDLPPPVSEPPCTD